MASIDYFKEFSRKQMYFAGQPVFRAGERTPYLYAVREGEIGLLYGDHELETVTRGGIFGEASIVDDGPQVVTAYARTECILVPVTRREFVFLVHETPMFAFFVMRTFAHRARLMSQVDHGVG